MQLRSLALRAALLACVFSAALAAPALSDTVTLSPRVFPVGKWADGMVFAGSSLWVSEAGQRTIAQLNLNNTVARRITVGRLPTKMTFANDGAIYTLVETDNQIWQQFPKMAQGKAIGGLDGGCPVYLTSGDQHVFGLSSCGTQPSRLTRIDPQGNRRSVITLPGSATQLVAAHSQVWVNTPGAPSVVDEQTLAVRTAAIKPVPGVNLGPFAENGAAVFLGTQGAGNAHFVLAIDPKTLQETARQAVDQQLAVMTSDEKHVVAIGLFGKIFVLSADRLELVRVINLQLPKVDPRTALIIGDDLYITNNQQQGEFGALLVLSNWRPPAVVAQPQQTPPPQPPQGTPAPQPPTQPPATPGVTDCPYQVMNIGDATGIWMYQDPDLGATKVLAVPADSKGLVADRCLANWCHVTFRGSSGWVQRSRIQAYCN
jgi:hypothetical protein